MKNILENTDVDNGSLPKTQRREQMNLNEMTDFANWCKEFRVSTLVSKNNEYTVLVGDHEKKVPILN